MNKITTCILTGLVSFAAFAQKDYVTFEAKIDNRNGDKIYILGPNKYKKEIALGKTGRFSDTLNIKEGIFRLNDGVENTSLYLKNGMDLKLKMDAKQFDESIVYAGKGEKENNFLAQTALREKEYNYTPMFSEDENEFEKLLQEKEVIDLERLENSRFDAVFFKTYTQEIKISIQVIKNAYFTDLAISKLNNTPSPSFDYENHKGGATKLEDLRGKYVYIDVWATWCGPCIAEIPHLKKLEEQFHGKNIEFVSISIDTKKDYEKWKKFVVTKELGGIQLFADNDWNSDFVKAYNITSIPRFILIDSDGKVVNANADRPSFPTLAKTLEVLVK